MQVAEMSISVSHPAGTNQLGPARKHKVAAQVAGKNFRTTFFIIKRLKENMNLGQFFLVSF